MIGSSQVLLLLSSYLILCKGFASRKHRVTKPWMLTRRCSSIQSKARAHLRCCFILTLYRFNFAQDSLVRICVLWCCFQSNGCSYEDHRSPIFFLFSFSLQFSITCKDEVAKQHSNVTYKIILNFKNITATFVLK